MDVATETSPIGLWTTVLKPQLWHYESRHLGFLKPEVRIFGREGELMDVSEEKQGVDLTDILRTFPGLCHGPSRLIQTQKVAFSVWMIHIRL